MRMPVTICGSMIAITVSTTEAPCTLMPSTPFAYPQVVSRHFVSFRVVRFDVLAGHS